MVNPVKKTISCALFALLVLAVSGSTPAHGRTHTVQPQSPKQTRQNSDSYKQSQKAAKSYSKQLKKQQKAQAKAQKKQMQQFKNWKKNHQTTTTVT